MAPRSTFAALAAAGLAVAATAQPAPGLAPLAPVAPSFPTLPPNAPAVLVRALEAAKSNPSSLPAYAPALIKAATTPVTFKTKEEHKAAWAEEEAKWKAEHPDGYKGMEKAGRRLAGHKDGEAELGEAAIVGKVHKAKKHAEGEAVVKAPKAHKVKTVEVGEAALGKAHKGRKLAGHKGAVDEAGEAVVIVKAPKAKKHAEGEAVVKAPKAHKVKTVEVGEAALGKAHKGRKLAGHKGAVDEAGEAVVIVKAPKVKKHADGEAGVAKHSKKAGKHAAGEA